MIQTKVFALGKVDGPEKKCFELGRNEFSSHVNISWSFPFHCVDSFKRFVHEECVLIDIVPCEDSLKTFLCGQYHCTPFGSVRFGSVRLALVPFCSRSDLM